MRADEYGGSLMDSGWRPPCSRSEFSALLAEVESVIDVSLRLPHLPFRASCGQVDVCEFAMFLNAPFAGVLTALADAHGDESIVLVTLDPDPFSYCERKFPGFRIARGDLEHGFWAQLNYELAGDTSGSIVARLRHRGPDRLDAYLVGLRSA